MSDDFDRIRGFVETANNSMRMMQRGVVDFDAASIIGDDARMEEARNRSIACLEAYFDALRSSRSILMGRENVGR